jgi:hypothetical protein
MNIAFKRSRYSSLYIKILCTSSSYSSNYQVTFLIVTSPCIHQVFDIIYYIIEPLYQIQVDVAQVPRESDEREREIISNHVLGNIQRTYIETKRICYIDILGTRSTARPSEDGDLGTGYACIANDLSVDVSKASSSVVLAIGRDSAASTHT